MTHTIGTETAGRDSISAVSRTPRHCGRRAKPGRRPPARSTGAELIPTKPSCTRRCNAGSDLLLAFPTIMIRILTMKGQALELISKIHLDWKRRIARALAPYEITPKQIFLLRKLKESATLTPSEVAVLIHGDRPSTTSMLDTLERSGWICRQRDPANGKRVIITMTAAGKEKLASVPERLWRSGKVPSNPESCLEPVEREELTRLLDKMHRWMNANPQER